MGSETENRCEKPRGFTHFDANNGAFGASEAMARKQTTGSGALGNIKPLQIYGEQIIRRGSQS
jgi:hypothetical protein